MIISDKCGCIQAFKAIDLSILVDIEEAIAGVLHEVLEDTDADAYERRPGKNESVWL
ncbi:MAG: hypothetical protein Q4C46_08840 [Bacillota bacterium]|nr:hypothetical protein [Bacillota bacterium]